MGQCLGLWDKVAHLIGQHLILLLTITTLQTSTLYHSCTAARATWGHMHTAGVYVQ